MNTGIETKRPLKVEYQTYEGKNTPLPFGVSAEDVEKGNIVTRDIFGAIQVYENELEFEKYHGELNQACAGDNSTIVTTYKDFVFTQAMPVSEPCEEFYKVRKRVQGDALTTKIEKLSIEKINPETTDERINEICDLIFDYEDKLKEKYNEKKVYKDLVRASFEGSIYGKGCITKDGEEIKYTDDIYESLPYGYKQKLSVNAIRLMSIQDDELGN